MRVCVCLCSFQVYLPASGWFRSAHSAHVFRPQVAGLPGVCGSLGDFLLREDQLPVAGSPTIASQVQCFVARSLARPAEGAPPLLAPPTGYRFVTEYASVNKGVSVFVFTPVAPPGYTALGSVCTHGPAGAGATHLPPLDACVCVSDMVLRDLGPAGATNGLFLDTSVGLLEPAFPLAHAEPPAAVNLTNGPERSITAAAAPRLVLPWGSCARIHAGALAVPVSRVVFFCVPTIVRAR